MDQHTATEQSYKNGYEAGVQAAVDTFCRTDPLHTVGAEISYGRRSGSYFGRDQKQTSKEVINAVK